MCDSLIIFLYTEGSKFVFALHAQVWMYDFVLQASFL
jgi:hypothetical protein